MKKSKYLCLIILLGCILNLEAKNNPTKPSPAWNVHFESDILWQQVTPLGNLVINTSGGLYGIDGQTGQKSWEINRFGNLPPDSYRPLPGTFFAEIVLPDAIVILNPYNGRIIGDTKKAGFKDVVAKNLLYEAGTKALEGRKFALVRVSKADGEITDIIDMQNEKEPSYQVDNISNSIFYRSQPHQIISYRF